MASRQLSGRRSRGDKSVLAIDSSIDHPPIAPARVVPVTTPVDGEVALSTQASVDGRPNADHVSGYLMQLEFAPSAGSARLGVAPGASTLTPFLRAGIDPAR